MEAQPIVRTSHLAKSYGHIQALRDASLVVEQGTTVAIVGDNGSGKSTLVKLLSGNIVPDSGYIVVAGTTFDGLSIRQSLNLGIRTVYQDLSLDNNKNSVENIFLGSELTRLGFLQRRAMAEQAADLLNRIQVHIPDLYAPAGRLSGGQRQGLAIARALRSPARLLILDEPLSAMGIQESYRAQQMLLRLKTEGVTQLIVSHNLHQVFELADRIFVMRNGTFIADIPTNNTSVDEVQDIILEREEQQERQAVAIQPEEYDSMQADNRALSHEPASSQACSLDAQAWGGDWRGTSSLRRPWKDNGHV